MPNAGCLTKRNALQKQILALSTRIRFRLKTHLSLCGLAFRPRVSCENGDQKRNFSKTLSKVEIKKKKHFRVFVWTVKTELFQNDDVTVLDPACPARKPREKQTQLQNGEASVLI